MIEYRITVDPSKDGWTDEEDRMIRAIHADDLCAAIWEIQSELMHEYKHAAADCDGERAGHWLSRLNAILHETGAAAAMERYT
jgi:hypothetical protein